jgi:hypothetical protein
VSAIDPMGTSVGSAHATPNLPSSDGLPLDATGPGCDRMFGFTLPHLAERFGSCSWRVNHARGASGSVCPVSHPRKWPMSRCG